MKRHCSTFLLRLILLLVGTTTTMEQTGCSSLSESSTPGNPQSQQATDNAIEQYIRSHPEVIVTTLAGSRSETRGGRKSTSESGDCQTTE